MANEDKGKSTGNSGMLALFFVFFANTANLLDSLAHIQDWITKVGSFKVHEWIELGAFLLLIAGYAVGYFWFRDRLAKARGGVKRIIAVVTIISVTSLVIMVNRRVFARPDPIPAVKKRIPEWIGLVFRSQADSGGIKIGKNDDHVQVWETAQCLTAVLANPEGAAAYRKQIRKAFDYIENARRSAPEPGWGYFPQNQRTITEITAWVALATVEGLRSGVVWSPTEAPKVVRARLIRDLDQVLSRQDKNTGGWRPIRDEQPDFTRTYSTVMALWCLIEARKTPIVFQAIGDRYDTAIQRGIDHLLDDYDGKEGWVANPNHRPFPRANPGLTAQVLFVLSRAEPAFPFLKSDPKYKRALVSFVQNDAWSRLPATAEEAVPNSDIYFHPTDFVAEASGFRWHPWALATFSDIGSARPPAKDERDAALERRRGLLSQVEEVDEAVRTDYHYVLAEELFCQSYAIQQFSARARR